MASRSPNRFNDIQVKLDLGDYLVTATSFHGEGSSQWWEDLGDLLYGRPGWYCHVANTGSAIEVLWSFGALGSSRFSIDVGAAPKYHVYDQEEDEAIVFDEIDELRTWLETNEARHLDYPRRLKSCVADSDWALLRTMTFDVDATLDSGMWIVTPRQFPLTFSSGASLNEALVNVRMAIAGAFDAPLSLAPSIRLVTHIDTLGSAEI